MLQVAADASVASSQRMFCRAEQAAEVSQQASDGMIRGIATSSCHSCAAEKKELQSIRHLQWHPAEGSCDTCAATLVLPQCGRSRLSSARRFKAAATTLLRRKRGTASSNWGFQQRQHRHLAVKQPPTASSSPPVNKSMHPDQSQAAPLLVASLQPTPLPDTAGCPNQEWVLAEAPEGHSRMTAARSCLAERFMHATSHTHSWQCARAD